MVETKDRIKVYRDIVSGDKMCSQKYFSSTPFGCVALEAKSRYYRKSKDLPPVIEIVDTFNLKRIKITKEHFLDWAKKYLKLLF